MGMLSQIRRSTANGENVKELEDDYLEIMEREPIIPLLPELFFEDVTQEALALQISVSCKCERQAGSAAKPGRPSRVPQGRSASVCLPR